MGTNENVPGRLESQLRAAAEGVKNVLPAKGNTFTVGNISYTVDGLASTLEGFADGLKAVRDERVVFSEKVVAAKGAKKAGTSLLADLKLLLLGLYGKRSNDLEKFGLKPIKEPAPLTSEAKVIKKAKMNLTRQARSTKGSRQKAAIRGKLDSVVVVSPDAQASLGSPAPAVGEAPKNGSNPTAK